MSDQFEVVNMGMIAGKGRSKAQISQRRAAFGAPSDRSIWPPRRNDPNGKGTAISLQKYF